MISMTYKRYLINECGSCDVSRFISFLSFFEFFSDSVLSTHIFSKIFVA